jgi:hypothetical protein
MTAGDDDGEPTLADVVQTLAALAEQQQDIVQRQERILGILEKLAEQENFADEYAEQFADEFADEFREYLPTPGEQPGDDDGESGRMFQ